MCAVDIVSKLRIVIFVMASDTVSGRYSGKYEAILSSSLSKPSPYRIPIASDVKLLLTENMRCGCCLT